MSNHSHGARISATDVTALDNEQRDRDSKDNAQLVPVKDPDNADEVACKLKPKSAVVDLQKLTARLLKTLTYGKRPTQHSLSSSLIASLGGGDHDQDGEQCEIDSIHDPVDGAGRPSCPREWKEDMIRDLGGYLEVLACEQDNDIDWEVLHWRVEQWLNFRRVQRLARERPFINDYHLFRAIHDESYHDLTQRCPGITNKTRGFPGYVQSTKQRLTRYGFTRPFKLNQTVAKQDKLSTWIEFINWEYVCFEQYFFSSKQCRRRREEAWRRLVDSGELRPGETKDELLESQHGLQRSAERHSAERAVVTAEQDLTLAEQALASSCPSNSSSSRELQQRVDAAQAKLSVAEDTHERVVKRNDYISRWIDTLKTHQTATDDVDRHRILRQWTVQQVRLIEQEETCSADEPSVEETQSDAALPDPAAGDTDAEMTSTRDSYKRRASTPHADEASFSPTRYYKHHRDQEDRDKQLSKRAKGDRDTAVKQKDCAVVGQLKDKVATLAITPK